VPVDQAISNKPIASEAESIAWALNKEVVPVVRRIRAIVNATSTATSATVGDGVTLVFDVAHALATADVFVAAYDVATGTTKVEGTDVVTRRLDTATVRLTYAVAPVSDRVLIRV
jgi:hypothetical protein